MFKFFVPLLGPTRVRVSRIATHISRATFSTVLKTPVEVPPEKMCSLKDSAVTNSYELMFATKEGLPIRRFPISHSAIAWHSPEQDHFLVYGRQSPYDPTKWLGKSLWSLQTRMDNEHSYLNKGFTFTAHPTGVKFSREEMELCLHLADEKINQKQFCNMINSNCYSYSATVMALAVQQLLRRANLDAEGISQILTVMAKHPLSDHYSIGVFNNDEVVRVLREMTSTLLGRLGSIVDKSPVEEKLLEQTLRLSERIAEESPKFRVSSVLGG